MPVETIPFPRIIPDRREVRRARKEALRAAFTSINQLCVNTGKLDKVLELSKLIQTLVNPQITIPNGNVQQLKATDSEPALPSASEVATHKARLAKERYLQSSQTELMFLMQQFNLALQNDVDDQVLEALLKGIVFVGSDINVFIKNPISQQMEQHHSKERHTEVIAAEDFSALRKSLYETYVAPKNDRIKVIWEIATAVINGQTHAFSDYVEVIADPIDAELLDFYLQQALADGKILSSNTHLALFELLCASGKMKSVAILSKEMRDKGYSFADVREKPTPEVLAAITYSINTNSPVYIA